MDRKGCCLSSAQRWNNAVLRIGFKFPASSGHDGFVLRNSSKKRFSGGSAIEEEDYNCMRWRMPKRAQLRHGLLCIIPTSIFEASIG